jgi:hypothetical protein
MNVWAKRSKTVTRNAKKNQETQLHVIRETPTPAVTPSARLSECVWQQPAPNLGDRPTDINVQISKRAYQRFVVRGGKNGYDVDDWLQAEADILKRS